MSNTTLPSKAFVLMHNDSPIAVYFDRELAVEAARKRTGDSPSIQTGYFRAYEVPVCLWVQT